MPGKSDEYARFVSAILLNSFLQNPGVIRMPVASPQGLPDGVDTKKKRNAV